MSTYRREYLGRLWRMIFLTVFLLLCMTIVHNALNSGTAAAASKTPPPATDKLPGQIEDDATVAPDAEESADNNVTFPVDI
jgi:hypothetical protein